MFEQRCYERDNDISGTFVCDDININIQGPIMVLIMVFHL